MFYKKLELVCKNKGTTPTGLAKSLGLSSSRQNTWKNSGAPKGDELAKIADTLDVSTDYLLGRTDNPQSHLGTSSVSVGSVQGNSGVIGAGNKTDGSGENNIVLAKDEQELLNDYRFLNDLGKGEARKRINELTKLEQYNSSDDSEGEVLIPIAARKARTTNRKLKKRNSNIKLSDLPDYRSGRK